MTDLRQAAQMALEALEGWEHCDDWVWPVSALEQSKRNTTESLAALRAALEQQAEPVAVYQWRKQGCADWYDGHPDYCDGGGPYETRILYTTPPQRKELSASEILNMMPSTIPAEYDGPLMEFARAIEAKLKERNGY